MIVINGTCCSELHRAYEVMGGRTSVGTAIDKMICIDIIKSVPIYIGIYGDAINEYVVRLVSHVTYHIYGNIHCVYVLPWLSHCTRVYDSYISIDYAYTTPYYSHQVIRYILGLQGHIMGHVI